MSYSPLLVACGACFGAADGPMLDAARLGVLVMVGCTTAMLTAFGVFFVRLARRSASTALRTGHQ